MPAQIDGAVGVLGDLAAVAVNGDLAAVCSCLLYTSPSPRDRG